MDPYKCPTCGELPHWDAVVDASNATDRRFGAISRWGDPEAEAFSRAETLRRSPRYCPNAVLPRLAAENGCTVEQLAAVL